MVYTRRKFTYRTRRKYPTRRRHVSFARKNKSKRIGQNLGKTMFWFKRAGSVTAQPDNSLYLKTTPNEVFPIPSFINQCRGFEQYKVLKVITKFYPAYVGSETNTASTAAAFRRGNVVTWIDQPPIGNQPSPGEITLLMGFPSSRLHQTRATIKRWMNRPSGGRFNDWAYITHPSALGVPAVSPDTWDSEIKIFGDNFGFAPGNNRPYFFVETLYKVVFRSIYRGGPP